MMISLIWAMDEGGLIGRDNALPWHLPSDLQWFKKNTLGKPIVMGRKTYESFGGRLLPQRTNIILSRDSGLQVEGAVVVNSLDQAINAAGDAEELMIIGGSNIYEQFLPHANRLYVTTVHGEYAGDAWFPDVDYSRWLLVFQEDHPADEANEVDYSFLIYDRA